MKPTECCAKCRFWLKGGSQMGNCRRYPPGFHAVWESFPKISGNGWCGEFKPKLSANDGRINRQRTDE